ncbi:MAG: FAD-dependent oxidoreductase [Planctomycetota bacterium]|nr:MAG: FAD-dependent oxidoreductase [Planctomycetota bacterium]
MVADVVIFGGGVAGLWLLDELHRRGYGVVLLEADSLGSGQTIASQGIIHGGLKYTLDGLLHSAAVAVSAMPGVWRDCLAARREPDLSGTAMRGDWCALWRTRSMRSRLGMLGARGGLQVRPRRLARSERPEALAGCPGDVFRIDEPVVSPRSVLEVLASRHAGRLLRVGKCQFEHGAGGRVTAVACEEESGERRALVIRPDHVVLAAGRGNSDLRAALGLRSGAAQLRPLHMVMMRGRLPALNGHCVDAAHTRLTITSERDPAGRMVWQVGGQVSEDGVSMDSSELVAHARREVQACIPALELADVEWATYRVDRAESAAGGRRPNTESVLEEGNVITAWPTKLALAPRLAQRILERLGAPRWGSIEGVAPKWPRPAVAPNPWETATWRRVN